MNHLQQKISDLGDIQAPEVSYSGHFVVLLGGKQILLSVDKSTWEAEKIHQ